MNESMQGFEVFDAVTLKRMMDTYAYTDDGRLLKQTAKGDWVEVPHRGEYNVHMLKTDGGGERW